MYAAIDGYTAKLFDFSSRTPATYIPGNATTLNFGVYLPFNEKGSLSSFKNLAMLLGARTDQSSNITITPQGFEPTDQQVLNANLQPVVDDENNKFYYVKLKYTMQIGDNFNTSTIQSTFDWIIMLKDYMLKSDVSQNYQLKFIQPSLSYVTETAYIQYAPPATIAECQPPLWQLPYFFPAEMPLTPIGPCSCNAVFVYNGLIPESISLTVQPVDGTDFNAWTETSFNASRGTIYLLSRMATNPYNRQRIIVVLASGISQVTGKLITMYRTLLQAPSSITQGVNYPEIVNTSFTAKELKIPITFNAGELQVSEIVTPVNWIESLSTTGYVMTNQELVLRVQLNQLESARSANIEVKFTNNTHIYIQINQAKTLLVESMPSWANKEIDVIFTEADNDYKSIAIYDGELEVNPYANLIYEAKVYKTGVSNTIDITEILNNSINSSINNFNTIDAVTPVENAFKQFVVYIDNTASYFFNVYYDYTFDENDLYGVYRKLLNRPVFHDIIAYAPLFISVYCDINGAMFTDRRQRILVDEYYIKYLYENKITHDETIGVVGEPITKGAAYNFRTTNIGEFLSDKINLYLDINSDASIGSRAFNCGEFNIVCPEKYKYILYYVNELGGIDWLNCTTASSESNNITNTQIKYNANINTRTEFGRYNYIKSNKKSWKLVTDMMYEDSDEQALLMQHCFRSPKCWLYDLSSEKFYAVNIIDNKMTNKTFMSNGNRYFNYTINVEDSQDEIVIT